MNKFKKWLQIKLKDFLDIGNLESNFKDHETFNSIRFSDIEKDVKETKQQNFIFKTIDK